MTSSEPVGPGVPPAPDDESGGSRWWVVVTLVVLAVVAVALLVAQPWVDHETEPIVVPTSTGAPSSPAATTPPAPSPTPSATPTTPPVPGADAVFDDSNVRSLLVRKADLEADVPAAADGIDVGIPTGELLWGLPEGSSVEPAECTIAVTVVATEPPGFVGRSYVNDRVDFVQQVVRLADPAAAQEAFRELVTTVDGCPQYSQVNPGIDGATWTAEPAIEGQGVYPAVVQEVLHSAEGVDAPSYRGHVLVGNTIVTWTATALGEGDREELLASLGTPESLSTMVQNRAHEAVQALG